MPTKPPTSRMYVPAQRLHDFQLPTPNTLLTSLPLQIEKQFAVKTVQHMATYWAILEKVRGSALRLTKHDEVIYEHLRRDFPELDPAATIDEEAMKSKEGKQRWRAFMEAYKEGEHKIDDYNFGTILRTNPKFEYGEKETIFGMFDDGMELVEFVVSDCCVCLQQFRGCSSMLSRLPGTLHRFHFSFTEFSVFLLTCAQEPKRSQ
jgi:hypothetical protein